MARRMSGSGVFWGLLVGILLALPAAYFLVLEPQEPPVSQPQPPPPVRLPVKTTELRITQLEGAVEIRKAQGPWSQAELNAVLEASDTVRTLDGAHAVLSAKDAYDVRLEPGTDISIDELAASISKLMLGKGMATARVHPGGKHAFEVRASGTDTVARSSAGLFAITHNGKGTVALGTQEGEVELKGNGHAVIVRAGQQSVVRDGGAPSDPVAVPSTLLTKVKWPEGAELRSRSLLIRGTTSPGAWLEIGGNVVPVDAQGGFAHRVGLREGSNEVTVRARGVGGIAHEEKRSLRVDTTPPAVGLDSDLWKK